MSSAAALLAQIAELEQLARLRRQLAEAQAREAAAGQSTAPAAPKPSAPTPGMSSAGPTNPAALGDVELNNLFWAERQKFADLRTVVEQRATAKGHATASDIRISPGRVPGQYSKGQYDAKGRLAWGSDRWVSGKCKAVMDVKGKGKDSKGKDKGYFKGKDDKGKGKDCKGKGKDAKGQDCKGKDAKGKDGKDDDGKGNKGKDDAGKSAADDDGGEGNKGKDDAGKSAADDKGDQGKDAEADVGMPSADDEAQEVTLEVDEETQDKVDEETKDKTVPGVTGTDGDRDPLGLSGADDDGVDFGGDDDAPGEDGGFASAEEDLMGFTQVPSKRKSAGVTADPKTETKVPRRAILSPRKPQKASLLMLTFRFDLDFLFGLFRMLGGSQLPEVVGGPRQAKPTQGQICS